MAYDKLVDSSQLNSDLGDVADAIRAKSGGSSQLAFPSGFISEIGNISTGGGGLPTGMTNSGSGSFTFASRTVLNTAINHGLSFTPRAVVIWTNTEPSAADMCYCLLTRQLANNTGTVKTERFLVAKNTAAQGIEITTYNSTDADFFITSTTFNIGHGSRYYAAGETYYWFAFA